MHASRTQKLDANILSSRHDRVRSARAVSVLNRALVRRNGIGEEPQVPRISAHAYSWVSWRDMEASQGNASLGLRLLGFVRQHVDKAKIQAPSSRSKHGDYCARWRG